VRLKQAEELVCSTSISSVVATDSAPSTYTGQFLIQNTGDLDVSVLSVPGPVGLFSVTPPLPFTIAPGASQIVALHAETSLYEVTMGVTTSCGTTSELVFPPAVEDTCGHTVVTSSSLGGGDVTITNTGTLPLTLTAFSITDVDPEYIGYTSSEFLGALTLPITISAGETVTGSGIFTPESEPLFVGTVVCDGVSHEISGQITLE
jgi:hypothetical protein